MLASGPSHSHSDSITSEPSAPPIPPPPPPFAIGSFSYAPSTRFPVNTPSQNNSPVPIPSPTPAATPRAVNSPEPWSTGLCDCFTDCSSCCLTFWCPCVTFGRIAEIVDRGATSCGVSGALYTLLLCLAGCSCLYSCFYRSKLRGQYFLEESPCIDCCVHCWCEGCALCQEYRELKNRGFDMSIGWYGNVERQRRGGVELNPVVPAGMTR